MTALSGLRVLDLTRILSGPYCTMLLADMGAEVIKVEPPGGDDTRGWGPPFVNGESAYFLAVNRGKRSIGLNLRSEAGREIFLRLLANADVVVENFRPGTLKRLGIGWDVIHAANPKAILASISGFGQSGPWADLPGYDVLAQAMGGLIAVTGEPGRPPAKAGFSVADLGAGMFACIGILAALQARAKTGVGQWVDASLYETMLSWQTYFATNFFATGEEPQPSGNAHPSIVPYQAFEAADGWFILAVGNDALWEKFKSATGFADPTGRWNTNEQRVSQRKELLAALEPFFKAKPAAHWLRVCSEVGIPCGPISRYEEIWSNPHVAAREMKVTLPHPTAGDVAAPGVPVKFSGTAARPQVAPPLLGQDTKVILREAGYSEAEIERFYASKTVF